MDRLRDLLDHRIGTAVSGRRDHCFLRNQAKATTRIILLGLLAVGLVVTPLVRPERFRKAGEELIVSQVDGQLETEVELIGLCLSISAGWGLSRSSWATTCSPVRAGTVGPSVDVMPRATLAPSICPNRWRQVSGCCAITRPAIAWSGRREPTIWMRGVTYP